MNKRSWVIWGALLSGSMAATATVSASTVPDNVDRYLSYAGTATALHSGTFLYRENHVLAYRGGRLAESIVLYTCQDGAPFARKTTSYGNALVPDFLLEDVSNGMREGIRSSGDVREVFFSGGRAASEKSGALPQVSGLVADSGFDAFVLANWQPLMDGKTLNMRFLMPSRLADMGFQVQHVSSERGDSPTEIFRLKLAGVLGWALPSIDVYYRANDPVLVRYVGLSDLRDASNNNLRAEITFPPNDRKPAGEQDMANARRARLRACR
jgi:hypothetical protein